jgi:hypothetical protein
MDHRTPLLAAAVIVPSLVGSILNWSRWILEEGEVDRDGRAAKSAGEKLKVAYSMNVTFTSFKLPAVRNSYSSSALLWLCSVGADTGNSW